jgi:hypothetical protein
MDGAFGSPQTLEGDRYLRFRLSAAAGVAASQDQAFVRIQVGIVDLLNLMRRQREAGDMIGGLQLLEGGDIRDSELRFDLHVPSSRASFRLRGNQQLLS